MGPGELATIHYHGRFADKPNLTIHYGFNGSNRISGVEDFMERNNRGNKNYFKDVAMTKSGFTGAYPNCCSPLEEYGMA